MNGSAELGTIVVGSLPSHFSTACSCTRSAFIRNASARALRFDFRRAQVLLALLDLDLSEHPLLDALLVGVREVDVLDLHADDVDRAAIDRRGDGRVEVVVQRGALLDGA